MDGSVVRDLAAANGRVALTVFTLRLAGSGVMSLLQIHWFSIEVERLLIT
jgi:hypothetical protein